MILFAAVALTISWSANAQEPLGNAANPDFEANSPNLQTCSGPVPQAETLPLKPCDFAKKPVNALNEQPAYWYKETDANFRDPLNGLYYQYRKDVCKKFVPNDDKARWVSYNDRQEGLLRATDGLTDHPTIVLDWALAFSKACEFRKRQEADKPKKKSAAPNATSETSTGTGAGGDAKPAVDPKCQGCAWYNNVCQQQDKQLNAKTQEECIYFSLWKLQDCGSCSQ